MQLRWSPAAVEDLFRIIEYIRPAAAQRIASTIYESAGSLKSFRNKGRTGRVDFLCHRSLSSWFIESAGILWEIANVIHGAQKWPPKD
jgi:plasmid stabilization system protein ParE